MDNQYFNNTYRIPSTRLIGRNYADSGSYFVTICTKAKYCWFGEIKQQVMYRSEMGQIIQECWQAIPQHYPHVAVDTFIVMPNHLHGIVVIGEKLLATVETPPRASLRPGHMPEWKSGCLGAIINRFKGACTRKILNLGHADFAWQPRFHDHVICDDREMETIQDYIVNNPCAWEKDDLYT